METSSSHLCTHVGFVVTAIDLAVPADEPERDGDLSDAGAGWFETRASSSVPEATVSVTGVPSGRCLDTRAEKAELTWVITNNSASQKATVNGLMQLHGETSADVADGVRLEYVRVHSSTHVPEGRPADGGTLGQPETFTLGDVLSPWEAATDPIAPGQSISLRVTATFDDPAAGPQAFETAVLALTYRFWA